MDAAPAVEVFWRPGCVWCVGLRRSLARYGVKTTETDIWQDADAAAFVRSVADGNETVPTVRIGDRVMVNPAPGDVMRALGEAAPAGWDARRRGPLSRVLDRLR